MKRVRRSLFTAGVFVVVTGMALTTGCSTTSRSTGAGPGGRTETSPDGTVYPHNTETAPTPPAETYGTGTGGATKSDTMERNDGYTGGVHKGESPPQDQQTTPRNENQYQAPGGPAEDSDLYRDESDSGAGGSVDTENCEDEEE